jgi:hypothetical protein
MPQKLELPIEKLNLLITCHDVKIRSLGTLIQKIFNTTDESLVISKEVTDAIQKLKKSLTNNKELSKSNLEKTNNLIKTIKTLQQTTKGTGRQIGLTDSYKQVVKAIVEYAKKIECPTPKPKINQNPDKEFLQSIKKLVALDDIIKEQFTNEKVKDVCMDKDESNSNCYSVIKNLISNDKKYKEYKEFFKTLGDDALVSVSSLKYNALADTKKKLDLYKARIEHLKYFIQEYHREKEKYNKRYKETYPDYTFRMRGGLISFLKMEIVIIKRNREEIEKRIKQREQIKQRQQRQQRQRGGSKRHKTKTTKKRIKGKQTRRNKVKNKTTIKAKNKTKKR